MEPVSNDLSLAELRDLLARRLGQLKEFSHDADLRAAIQTAIADLEARIAALSA